jgi:V/A-type H+/Na+-transporting ATPase subunit C
MASAAAQFAYLHGRVSVLSEQLLSGDSLQRLIDCSREEEKHYLELAGLGHLDEANIDDSAQFEQALITDLIGDAGTLSHALNGTARDLLMYWTRRFELGNLKAIIRGKLTAQPVDTIRDQLISPGQFATLPIEDLLRTDDVAELLRRLEETPYSDIARQARRVYEEQQQLFALDAAIDRRYLAGLSKRAKVVGPGGGEALRTLIGVSADRINLSWLLRYRFAYNLAPAETYYLLAPTGFRLSTVQLRELAQLGSIEEVVSHCPPAVRRLIDGLTSTTEIDRALEREVLRIAALTLHRTTFNLARAFAYLMLRRRDLDQIYAILKGKRLGIAPAQIGDATGIAPRTAAAPLPTATPSQATRGH